MVGIGLPPVLVENQIAVFFGRRGIATFNAAGLM